MGKHPRGRTVAAGLAPAFMPKHNSEPIGNGGSTGFDAALSRLANTRSLRFAWSRPFAAVNSLAVEVLVGESMRR